MSCRQALSYWPLNVLDQVRWLEHRGEHIFSGGAARNLARLVPARSLVEDLSNLLRQCSYCERLLQKGDFVMQNAMSEHCVVHVAAGKQNAQFGIARLENFSQLGAAQRCSPIDDSFAAERPAVRIALLLGRWRRSGVLARRRSRHRRWRCRGSRPIFENRPGR